MNTILLNQATSRMISLGCLVLMISCWTPTRANSQLLPVKQNSVGIALQYGQSGGWELTSENLEIGPSELQTMNVGFGQSQVIGNHQYVYVVSGTSEKAANKQDPPTLFTTVTAYQLGKWPLKEAWSYRHESKLRGKQETFGGSGPASQSTPLIVGNHLVAITFTGHVVCLDIRQGNLVWEIDLVEQYSAKPVQFGFSASPVLDTDNPGQIMVMAAGKGGGLLNLEVGSGKLNWKASCATPSYATPVSAKLLGKQQWLIVSEDAVSGIDQDNGQLLWRHELAEKGLTNVPSPLVVNDSQFLISGQGVKGVRSLKLTRSENRWTVQETWFQPRVQYFYTNWIQLDQRTILGCTDKYLAALDTTTGQILGRYRGFGDGNLVRIGNRIACLNGKGQLSLFQLERSADSERLTEPHRYRLVNQRCWTPPTLIAGWLYWRLDDELVRIKLEQAKGNPLTMAQNMATGEALQFAPRQDLPSNDQRDPVATIFQRFQQEGKQAAWQEYSRLRRIGELSKADRQELAAAAEQQGLNDMAAQIRDHIQRDFDQ